MNDNDYNNNVCSACQVFRETRSETVQFPVHPCAILWHVGQTRCTLDSDRLLPHDKIIQKRKKKIKALTPPVQERLDGDESGREQANIIHLKSCF